MRILLLLILSYSLYSSDIFSTSNSIELSERYIDRIESTHLYRFEYRNYSNIYYGPLSVRSTTIAYTNNQELKRDGYTIPQDKDSIYFEKLYLQYRVNENLSFVYGYIPLVGGDIKQYSNMDRNLGNSLFTLIDSTLQGGFAVLSDENSNLRIGYAEFNKNKLYNDSSLNDSNDGSSGEFLLYSYKQDKHTFIFNYIHSTFLKDYYVLAKNELLGIGYSYDDSEDSGNVLYSILGFSKTKSNTLNWVKYSGSLDQSTINISLFTKKYMSNISNPNNDTWNGYSVLLGYKKYTDILGYDFNLGVEYFKASDNWVSINTGSVTANDYGYYKHHGSDTYKIYSDFYIRSNIILNTSITYSNNLKTTKLFSISDVYDKEDERSETIYSMRLLIKF